MSIIEIILLIVLLILLIDEVKTNKFTRIALYYLIFIILIIGKGDGQITVELFSQQEDESLSSAYVRLLEHYIDTADIAHSDTVGYARRMGIIQHIRQ